ncbi:LacI family DNA-binding transcriptional regulator [Pseudonocardia sp. CA-107938]|uniref:LacI family DNA-binding transcriptional regulator n=1 Tax=Pseudonocardia sp. CA-107938 TaxID=3240021 RepID=UPI003D905598
MDHTRAVTLHDVAREAGVAVSTVSRALSNPDRVNARTREHVRAVAQRLDYRPNRIAQALPTGSMQMLGMLVPDITNPHHFGLIRGAEAQARAAGYTLVLGDTQGLPGLEAGHTQRLASTVDGFLLVSPRGEDDSLHAVGTRRPVVLYNRELDGVRSVVTDAADAAGQVVDHLHALGHRSIAYLAGPADSWTEHQRHGALARRAADVGIAVRRIGPHSPTMDGGTAGVDAALATRATAVVAFNDLMAIGALRRLERRGVDVPGEVSVVGFDDIYGADFCHPPLTTVAAPVEEAGRRLVDALLAGPDAPFAERTVLPTTLLVRDSTGPVAFG